MTDDDRQVLKQAIEKWRAKASKAGSLHSAWELIADAQSALSGGRTIIPIADILQIAREEISK